MVCPVGAGLERVERLAQVVDRASQRGEVEDIVDRLVDLDALDHVVVHECERVVPEMLEVRERARLQVVDADHALTLLEQMLAEM